LLDANTVQQVRLCIVYVVVVSISPSSFPQPAFFFPLSLSDPQEVLTAIKLVAISANRVLINCKDVLQYFHLR
jgi:hypothetical protein